MKIPDFDLAFLAVIAAGALIKVFTSERLTLWGGTITAGIAIFSAVVFTDPIAVWLGLEASPFRYAIAALLTLSGEAFVRFFISLKIDGETIVTAYKTWRGIK